MVPIVCVFQQLRNLLFYYTLFAFLVLPRFLTRPANLKVGIGQDARFECKVQAEPGYKIIWQRINRAQSAVFVKGQTEKRITIFDDGRLQIKNVQKNDEASYVCTVISGDKTESASARLSVVCKFLFFTLVHVLICLVSFLG